MLSLEAVGFFFGEGELRGCDYRARSFALPGGGVPSEAGRIDLAACRVWASFCRPRAALSAVQSWGHCGGGGSQESPMAKSRSGDMGLAELSPACLQRMLRGPSSRSRSPSACPLPALPRSGSFPLLTSGVSMESFASLTFLTPIPRAFPLPPQSSALNYNKSSRPSGLQQLLPHRHSSWERGGTSRRVPPALR